MNAKQACILTNKGISKIKESVIQNDKVIKKLIVARLEKEIKRNCSYGRRNCAFVLGYFSNHPKHHYYEFSKEEIFFIMEWLEDNGYICSFPVMSKVNKWYEFWRTKETWRSYIKISWEHQCKEWKKDN